MQKFLSCLGIYNYNVFIHISLNTIWCFPSEFHLYLIRLSLEAFSFFPIKQSKMELSLCLLHCFLISLPSITDGFRSPITHYNTLT